jgi:hypothetical protein
MITVDRRVCSVSIEFDFYWYVENVDVAERVAKLDDGEMNHGVEG